MEQVIGIFLLTVGCFSSASFYVPSYRIKKWSWETYWISLGFVAWIIMPTVGGLITTPDLWGILRASPAGSMAGAYVFGALWGFGGLMCGLALRHLGLARSVDFARGLAIVGTLVPAMLEGKIGLLVSTVPGVVVLLISRVPGRHGALRVCGVLKSDSLPTFRKRSDQGFRLGQGILRLFSAASWREHGVGIHGGQAHCRSASMRALPTFLKTCR